MADQIALEFVPLVEQLLSRLGGIAEQIEQTLAPLGRGTELKLEVEQAQERLAGLRDQLVALGDTPVELRFDPALAEEGIAGLETRFAELQAEAAVVIDPAPAVAALEEIDAAVGATAGALEGLGAAGTQAGAVIAEGAAAAEPGLANVSALAYRAATAVDLFATQAATAAEVTPQLALRANRAAAAIDALASAITAAAAAGSPVSPSQLATLQILTDALRGAVANVAGLQGAMVQQAVVAGQATVANQGNAAAVAALGASAATTAGVLPTLQAGTGGVGTAAGGAAATVGALGVALVGAGVAAGAATTGVGGAAAAIGTAGAAAGATGAAVAAGTPPVAALGGAAAAAAPPVAALGSAAGAAGRAAVGAAPPVAGLAPAVAAAGVAAAGAAPPLGAAAAGAAAMGAAAGAAAPPIAGAGAAIGAAGAAAAGAAPALAGAGAGVAGIGGGAAAAAPAVTGLTRSLGGLRQMAAFYLALRLERALSGLFGSALEAEEGMERITASFEHATGSATKAGQEIDFVRRLSEQLGTPFKEAALAYGEFAETMKQSAVPLQVERDLFVGVAAATAALHLPAKEAQAALEDFARAGNRAEVQLRQLQAINRAIPGSTELVAHALFQGTDALAQFEAEVRKGNVTVGQFFAVLGPAYAREFGDKLPAAVGSTRAELNRLDNTEFGLAATTSRELTPAIRGAVDAMNDLLKTSPETATGLGVEIAKVIELLQALIAEFVAGVKIAEVPMFGFGTVINEVAFIAAHALRSVAEVTPGMEDLARGLKSVEEQLGINALALKEETEGLVSEAGRLNQVAANATSAFLDLGDGARRSAGDLSVVDEAARHAAAGIDIQGAAILRAIEAIEKQADAIGRVGPVERLAADDLVKQIDKQLKAIAELPIAERRALADRSAELDRLRTHYEVFTTAYIKLQEQQQRAAEATARREAQLYKEREDALVKFLAKEQADLDKAAAERAKKAGTLDQSLTSQKGRLSELQGKDSNTVDEINEMDALRKSIRDTEEETRKLRDAQLAAGDAGVQAGSEIDRATQKVRDGYAQAIAQDDKLREAIAQLGPASRDSLGSVLEGLARLKGEGRLTEEDIRQAGSAIVGIFTDAGVVTGGLADRVSALTHQSRDLRATLADVKTTAQETAGASQVLATAQQGAATATTQAGTAHKFNAEQAREDAAATGAASVAQQAGSEISIKAAAATSGLNEQLRIKTSLEPQLAGSIDKVTSAQDAQTASTEGATAGTMTFRDEVVELSKRADDAGAPSGGIMRMGGRILEVGKNATGAAPPTKDLATSADQLGTAAQNSASGLEAAGGKIIDFKSAAEGAKDSTSGIASELSAVASDAAKVPAALQPVDILLGQIVDLKADVYLEKVATALADIAPAAERALTGLKALAKFDVAPIVKIGDALKVADQEGAAPLAVDLAKVVDACGKLKSCQDALQA